MPDEIYVTRKPEEYTDIAIIGPCHFARQGIVSLLRENNPQIRIKASVNDYQVLEMVLEKINVDIIIFSEPDKGNASFNCLKFIGRLKSKYPGMMMCMYTLNVTHLFLAQSDIDICLSLRDSLNVWNTRLRKLIDNRGSRRVIRRSMISSVSCLTQHEWQVLKEIRKGQSLKAIAEQENLSYRRVSALKSSAIRKLGLRNKNDLLVFLVS